MSEIPDLVSASLKWRKVLEGKDKLEKDMLALLKQDGAVEGLDVERARKPYREAMDAYLEVKEVLMRKYPNKHGLEYTWNIRG